MKFRLFFVLLLSLAMLGGCVPDKKRTYRPPPPRPIAQNKATPTSRRAVHTGTPVLSEAGVRGWFKKVSFTGYRRISIFNEFHPDDGSLVARYRKGSRMLYLTYIDNQRMSQYGFARTAREMIEVGSNGLAREIEIKGRTWYGDDTTKPTLGIDVSPDVRLLLMGYEHLGMEDLEKLAREVPVDALAKRLR